jgi:hypothetical protein
MPPLRDIERMAWAPIAKYTQNKASQNDIDGTRPSAVTRSFANGMASAAAAAKNIRLRGKCRECQGKADSNLGCIAGQPRKCSSYAVVWHLANGNCGGLGVLIPYTVHLVPANKTEFGLLSL